PGAPRAGPAGCTPPARPALWPAAAGIPAVRGHGTRRSGTSFHGRRPVRPAARADRPPSAARRRTPPGGAPRTSCPAHVVLRARRAPPDVAVAAGGPGGQSRPGGRFAPHPGPSAPPAGPAPDGTLITRAPPGGRASPGRGRGPATDHPGSPVMCEYCGCQSLTAIDELTREHDEVVRLISHVRTAHRKGDTAGMARTARAVARVLGPHTRVEEHGLFPALAGDFPD